MLQVETITEDYIPLAEYNSKIFFALVGMGQVHYLYEFSLQFFMDIFIDLIQKDKILNEIPRTDLVKRRKFINDNLFIKVYEKVIHSLLQKDRITF